MRNVIDQSNYLPDGGILLDNEDIVDRDGYRSTEAIVNEMIYAGQRLSEFRREEFDDFDGEMDEDEIMKNVTKDVGYDVIDAIADMTRLENKYKEEIIAQKKMKEEREKAEKEKFKVGEGDKIDGPAG